MKRSLEFRLVAIVLPYLWLAGGGGLTESAIAWQPPVEQPNIVLINLDDADFEMLSPQNLAVLYPNLQRFASDGICFNNFHVTTPLCGPSRACLLRGQYAHTTGIRCNDPFSYQSNGFSGGMASYGAAGYHDNDISAWMKAAGYRTMMVGKFLHHDVVNVVPSCWDDFYSSRGANYFGTARFSNKNNPQGEAYVEPIDVYRTVKESEEAMQLIDAHVARDGNQPFFLYLAPLAPHQQTPHTGEGMVEPRYQNWWPYARMPRTQAVNELDFTDKTTAIRDLAPLSPGDMDQLDVRHRERLLAVKSVDDMFAALTAKLAQYQLSDNTYVFLTSDNGFSNGHHRLTGKSDCFDRSTHVPMYVLGPGIPGGVATSHLLAHIDIAPTIAELAGAWSSPLVDGKSFVPLLFAPQDHDEHLWRNAILIENWESRIVNGANYNTSSLALRMYDAIYAEWGDGSREYYDLATDPEQLSNLIDTLPAFEQDFLADYLRTFRPVATAPETTITAPFEINELVNKKLPIRGMAEDDSGITRVRLVIKRLSDYWYWNGDSWQPDRVTVDASVTNPGQQLTTWSYDQIPRGQPQDDLIGIWARAYDDNRNYDTDLPWMVFRVDHTRPTSEILEPLIHETVPEFKIHGEAVDQGGVESLRLVIRDLNTGQYYDGLQWVNAWSYFVIPVKPNGRWNYDNPALQGSFFVSTRAVDESGNVQSPPTQTRFTVQP